MKSAVGQETSPQLFSRAMPETGSTLHVSSAFDRNYITPFYVLITSLLLNNTRNDVVIHSIATGVSEAEKAEIKNFVRQHKAEIFFYDIDEAYVRRHVVLPPDNVYFTVATYYRLFLPSLVAPVTKRLLYIDTDAVVRDDLRALYNSDIGQVPFAAVPDSYPHLRNDLGIHERGKYFNAGVLLIDVEAWKQHRVTEKALQFMTAHPEKIKFVDQDALNATQQGNWHPLNKKYNVTWFDVLPEVPKKELLQNAAIIHYTGGHKPWNALGENKLRRIYHHYLKQSPQASQSKYVDFRWSLQDLKKFFFIRLLEQYFEHPQLVKIVRKIRGRAVS